MPAVDLPGDWRAAERRLIAAGQAASVAALALEAAKAAELAADETEAAAQAAFASSESARQAAASAKRAAAHAAEAARTALVTAEGDKVRANHDVEKSEAAEADARGRFHDAESKGFPKE